MKKAFGTAENVEPLEVGVDTVYIRTNAIRKEKFGVLGWEYDEVQYSKDDFIGLINAQNKANADRADFLEELIVEMAMIVYP